LVNSTSSVQDAGSYPTAAMVDERTGTRFTTLLPLCWRCR
jgi:hypothetical protein